MNFISLPIVLDAVVKASVILAVTALAAVALRRASAAARHLLWSLGLLSALAAPALSAALPRWELPLLTIAAPVADTTATLSTPVGNEPAVTTTAPASFRGHQPAASANTNSELPPSGGRSLTRARQSR